MISDTKRSIFFVAIAILLTGVLVSFTLTNSIYSGTAYDKDSPSSVLFTEHYTDVIINNKVEESTVVFKDKSQKVIADKKVNFRKSSLHPDFRMENKLNGCIEASEKTGNDFKLSYRKNKTSELKSKTISVPAPAIADAGVTNLVIENLEKLKKGETITFSMIVPERFDYYSFRLTKDKTTKHSGKDAIVIKMESDSYIIRQLISPIMMTIDLNTKKTLQYEGASNITNEDGDRYEVKIVYN